MKSIAKTKTDPHRCPLPSRCSAFSPSMPAQEILQCEECGQNWWMTWWPSPLVADTWRPVKKRISERKARRLANRWKKP